MHLIIAWHLLQLIPVVIVLDMSHILHAIIALGILILTADKVQSNMLLSTRIGL